MKHYHPYRFPPLVGKPPGASAPATDAQAWQASVERGFEQGRQDGHAAGFHAGRDAGFALGHHAGLAQGRDEGNAATQHSVERLARPFEAMLAALRLARAEQAATQRNDVVALVAKVARQVIRAELALQPLQLLALVDEALAAMPPTREAIEVYLNPEELQRIGALDEQSARRWNLLADPRLAAGECRIRAGDNEVDAGCRQRLDGCIEQLGEHLRRSAGNDETGPHDSDGRSGGTGTAP